MRGLRVLRVLVTVLTAVMIVGMVAMVALFAARFPRAIEVPAPPTLPDRLEMPAGARPQAVTAGQGWWAVVTEAGDLLLFGADGRLTRRIPAGELTGD